MSKTSASCFVKGKAGEQYVRDHIQCLLTHGFIKEQKDTAGDNVEGGDSRVIYCRFGEEIDLPDYIPDGWLSGVGKAKRIISEEIGGLEVKTINNFTFRNNDNNEPSGTLPFELWNGDRYGWLFALLYPELRLKHEDDQPIHAVQPVLFCFLLISYLGPYACVMFEDFPALVQRLKDYAEEQGFELIPKSDTHPNGVPIDDDIWRQDDPYIIENCWHVPLERLVDLATITMLGEMPLIKRYYPLRNGSFDYESDKQYVNLQQSRYSFLQQYAGNRMIPGETKSETEFYPSDQSFVFADALKNIKIIEHLDQEEYPFLFKALCSRGMRDHLNCVLFNMYSHDFPTIVNGRMVSFLQTKSYLEKWSKGLRIPGSTFSWQAHLIFLMDAGLIRKFVDTNKLIDKQMFRNVPRYTSVILRFADDKAKQYIDAGINLNKFRKAEVIAVSGKERADILYYGDDRTISSMQKIVDDMFISTVKHIIDEKGYAFPVEVIDDVQRQINDLYWVDPWDTDVDPERQLDFEKANRELTRTKERLLELAIKAHCEYRRLTKEEKITFHLTPRNTKMVYIK